MWCVFVGFAPSDVFPPGIQNQDFKTLSFETSNIRTRRDTTIKYTEMDREYFVQLGSVVVLNMIHINYHGKANLAKMHNIFCPLLEKLNFNFFKVEVGDRSDPAYVYPRLLTALY